MASYATAEEVRLFTNVTAAENIDAALVDMIEGATAKIDRLTGRTWQGVQTVTDELYTGKGDNRLILNNRDIVAITALSINQSATGTTYTDVTPARARVQTRTGLVELQVNAEVPFFPQYFNSTKISYTWGEAVIPDDIRQACLYLVAYMLKLEDTLNKDFTNIVDSHKIMNYYIP